MASLATVHVRRRRERVRVCAGAAMALCAVEFSCGEGLGTDNASVACQTDPALMDANTASALTVTVDPAAASGTPETTGACTSLSCTIEYDAGGCVQWKGLMTATGDASCTVTFDFADSAVAKTVLSTGNVCGHPASRGATVTASGISSN